jgi:hypothetical protein
MAETKMLDDLIALQGKVPSFEKTGTGNFGSYIKLEVMHKEVLPLLGEHNFAWVTMPSIDEHGNPTLKYSLIHATGEKIEGEMLLMLGQNTPQGQGSSITYARRYALASVLGLVADVDDDGQKATDEVVANPQPRASASKPVTEPQSKLIASLAPSRFASKEEMVTWITLIIGKPSPTNSAEASKVIEEMMKLQNMGELEINLDGGRDDYQA